MAPSSTSISTQDIREFLQHFYDVSDDPNASEEWVDLFASDAKLLMSVGVVDTTQGIRDLRAKILSGYGDRIAVIRHHIGKIYRSEDEEGDIMLYGTVDYDLKDGSDIRDVPWAVRAAFSGSGKSLKLSLYQVYLNPGDIKRARG